MSSLLKLIVSIAFAALIGGMFTYYGASAFHRTTGSLAPVLPQSEGAAAAELAIKMPQGDPQMGKVSFKEMKCLQCHQVLGEGGEDVKNVGPELSDIGSLQSTEYLMESILSPNALIVKGEGYVGEDGLSKMPEYHDTMTLRQLFDIVAYMKTLQGEPVTK